MYYVFFEKFINIMNTDQEQIATLAKGIVIQKVGHGKSMQPKIMDGTKVTIIPVLSEPLQGVTLWDGKEAVKAGDQRYITPDTLKVGDVVFCKCRFLYMHEIHQIDGQGRFLIGRHDRKRMNGWTRKVFGLVLT